MNDRTCPAPGCTAALNRSTFACRPHWYGLPSGIRAGVQRAWRAYQRDPLAAAGDLLDAQAEATAWWARPPGRSDRLVGAPVSTTVLSCTERRAAHGLHRCEWCRRPIAARSRYTDRRIAQDGTAYTWRVHNECDRLVGQAANYWAVDDDDLGDPGETVCSYQADIGLPVGWPEVPT